MDLYERPLAAGGELLVEQLVEHRDATGQDLEFDVVIVGSGYGGSVAAARLTEDIHRGSGKLSVCVLERGLEHLPGAFPARFADLPRHVRINRFDTPELTGDAAGLFDVRIGKDVSVLVGNGLGGGSLINAGVAERPDPGVFDARWPSALQDAEALGEYFDAAARMLGAGPAKVEGLAKYREFEAWAQTLGIPARPAKVAVTFRDASDNGHGVEQRACINCGDCFTGCNYHAKNTLPMNYLARASRNGASLYTGITVSRVALVAGSGWSVHFSLTPRPGMRSWQREQHCVRARSVILAAGALGSTEILRRSQSVEQRFSDALGTCFSCNGDMISALYGQDNTVNAAPRENAPACARNVGPTITGIARRNGSAADRVVLEELAIPGALRRVFEEVVTAGALPYRVAGFDSWPASAADPLAVDPDAVDRTQVFAAMGEDAATGELEMIPGWNNAANPKVADGVMTVKWPQAASDPIYERQDQCMEHGITRGGEYLRSPLWQPLPREMAEALGGVKPGGRVLTVHPLGGCPMADDVKSGVVNHLGQVFRRIPSDEDVYRDLLVLDGSIVPVALGINPLLTIAALAERAIRHYVADNVKRGIWQLGPEHRIAQPRPVWAPAPAHATAQRAAETPVPTGLRFAERVQGDLTLGSIHEAKLALHFEAVKDVPGFLRDGARKLRIESGELQATPQGTKRTRSAKVHGNVVLLERCDERPFTRTLIALWAFLWKRGIADWLQSRREKRVARGGSPTSLWDIVWGCVLLLATPLLAILGGLAAEIGCLFWPRWQRTRRSNPARVQALIDWIREWAPWLAMIPLAYQTGEARRLCYRLTLEEDLELKDGRLPKGTRIEGRKILRYKLWGNPWWQLFELPVSIKAPEDWFATRGSLNVDLEYFFRRYATQLQLTQQRDLPSGLTDLASTVLFLLRAVGKVHFWSFRLPEYQKHDPKLKEHRTPGALRGLEWEPVDLPGQGDDLPPLLVTHYWKKDKPRGKPVVLFHGLGASGNQFATPKLDTNLVQHLAEQGRDVWVAELRHSIALDSSLRQWTLDKIALGDVPRIVAKVLERTQHPKVDVVAHCIGSAMFCIAALAGKLQRNGASMIDAAVLMQVGPLITLSDGTRIRAYLAAFLRRYLMESFVDFSVDDKADWVDSLVDRVLATYPYPASEAHHHDLVPPWKPQLHLANCNRWAAIDGRMLQHENLDERMLHSLGEILGHSNITTWEQTIQYAYLERLTDHEACNSYVTEKNIRAYFGFPVRLIHGAENDVFSVKTSQRSCQLLKQVWGENHPCDVREIKGYSHLDPLIGKNACRDVYPEISEFLSEQRVIKPFHRPAPPEMRRPLIGPVVGWTRKNAQGLWTVRVWCRIDDTRSPCSYVIVVPRKDGTTMAGKWKAVDPRPGRVDTLAVFDVDLDADNADYEIIVMSVHPSGAQPVPKQQKGLWAGLASPEVDVPDHELRKRVAEVERLAPRLKDRCTTDPHYDEPLDRAILNRAVLEQISGSGVTRFALASCRYGASVIDRERADATFGALSSLVESGDAAATPGLLLLAGDQIYADQTAGVFDPRGRRERFYEAYREAWTAPHARAVLSRLPTYMMMDDHEVSDNWHPKDPVPAAEARLRREGLDAFQEYQLLHSPRHPTLSAAQLLSKYPPEGFGYEFSAAGFPFFVFDTRSGRERADYIMQNQQMQNFGVWLDRCGPDDERPKFVVSPSIVVPYRRASGPERAYASRSDGWDGYPESLKELFAAIWSKRARNVVFLCGDAHFSMASRIQFVDSAMQPQAGLNAYCVVSSGLYEPFPFANSRKSDYLEANGSRLLPVDAAAGVFMHYRTLDQSYLEADSFTLVEVAKVQGEWRIRLRHHTASGPCRSVGLTSEGPPILEPAGAIA